MKNISAYTTEHFEQKKDKVQYLFISKGVREIVKAVEYNFLQELSGRKIYNLGFGDYNPEDGSINDNINSNNGDMRSVFSTVLNTVPLFFEEKQSAGIWVQGSDSLDDFRRLCEESCTKNCDEVCKNYNRRIKTYQYYLNKNYELLKDEYMFFGLKAGQSEVGSYHPENDYVGILVFKK